MKKFLVVLVVFLLLSEFLAIGGVKAIPNDSVITLTSPNGGETWHTGETRNITWTTATAGNYVTIYYSKDSGANWALITCVSNTGSYSWHIPDGINTTHARIKVNKVSGCGGIAILYGSDTSNSDFAITPPVPVITLTSPNGGETWHTGETHNITWTTATAGYSVSMSYSTDSGANWTHIDCVSNTGSYSWHIPDGINTTHARIRVAKESGCSGIVILLGSDTSNSNFTITPPVPVITLTSPNGGETWHTGETHNITWTTATAGNYVSMSYSIDSGANWALITCVSNTGSYSWHIPDGINTTHARIMVRKVSGCSGMVLLYGSDTSNSDFAITPPVPVITLTSPNGGETWHTGETHNITWTTATAGYSVSISYSTDSGANWTHIDCVSNTGSYSWHIPDGINTTHARIRVAKESGCSGIVILLGSDTSNSNFTITPPVPVITLTSPNGGETWHTGETHNITWTTATAGNYVSMSYSIDSGANWALITCVSNTGSYSWHIPDGINTTHARIMVRKVSGCSGMVLLYGSDTSNSDFAITPPGVPPVAPSGLNTTAASCNRIDLAWTDNSNNEDGFKIERKEIAGSYTEVGTVGTNITEYSDTTVSPEKTYYYRVRAYNGYGNSDYSNETNITTPPCGASPSAPTNLIASVISSSEINLIWIDNSDNEDGFKIERKESGGTYSEIKTLLAGTTSYSDTGLNPNTTYYYRVRAFNSYGISSYSNEANATTMQAGNPPTAPTNLFASATSKSEISLSWSDISDNEDGFKVERKVQGGTYAEIKILSANTNSYSDTGLNPDTKYYYRIRAYNGYGNSDYSNEANATTLKEAIPPPEKIIIRLYIDKTTYYVNDELKTMDAAPIIKESRTLLPIRYVAEALGAVVQWDAVERKVTITFKETIIELWIDKNTALVNGEYKLIDSTNPKVVPIIIPPGRTMLPIRFIAENLGCRVDWDPALKEVKITYPAP